ncbi:MAG: hypothetical protein QNK19_03550 [Xanthomonadales bacterium]|nr:hypothetical protein [Xanthomonadales bacterium]
MSRTDNVSHVSLTVSTVGMFIKTMKLMNEYDLWEEMQTYLGANEKTDMFVDYEVLFLLREMLEQDSHIDEDHPVLKILADHDDDHINRFIRPRGKHDSE